MATIDSQATTQHIKLDRGERAELDFTITNKSTGAAIDITNHTVEMVVTLASDGSSIVVLNNGVGDHKTPASGITQFILTHTHTMLASATVDTKWDYALHWKDDSSPANEDIAVQGKIFVRAVPVQAIA